MVQTNIKYAIGIMAVGALYIFAITFMPSSWRSVEGTEFAKTALGFILGSLFTIFTQYYWGASKKNPSDSVMEAASKAEATRIDEAAKLEAKNIEDAKVAEAKAKVEAEKLQAAQTEAAKTEGEKTE